MALATIDIFRKSVKAREQESNHGENQGVPAIIVFVCVCVCVCVCVRACACMHACVYKITSDIEKNF